MARLSSIGSALLAVGLLVSTFLPPEPATADVLGGATDSVLGSPAHAQPGSLGDGSVGGLQYANPSEQMVVMAPPQPNSQGGAQLQHPLLIPAGRGIAPSLALTYASAAGSSWVGTGWDLSVGDISVDTRWGVPRYDLHKESETYLLDGKQLSPTAVRSGGAFQSRVTDRSDFTFRSETSHDLIIRHGTNPKDYWWEVRDKSGGIRWYGGFPDAGGPNVNVASNSYPSLKQDPSAILFDDNGNAYRWGLSAERDVGVNLIRYFYDQVDGQRVGASQAAVGRQMYLSKIRYTGAASVGSAPPDDPAYEVRFLRDAAVNTAPSDPRKDVSVSGRGGFLEVTSDLLRRVEIWYGAPAGGGPRNYNIPSRSYDLNYTGGEFGKSLLQSVDQKGSDGQVYAKHTFDYFDGVRDPSTGAMNGWSGPVEWAPPSDNLQQTLVTTTSGPSVLGGSVTNSGDGHAFIGFNADNPTKEGAFGGMFTISAGVTEAQAEFIDINGDGLPDKVFREGDAVSYRLNTSGPNLAPGATPTFGDKKLVANLHKLSTETDIGLAGGVEADIGVDIQFTVGGDVTIGEDYFADVNGDGLPDFVSGGVVYFSHLDGSGKPTFEQSSANTPVPIKTTTTTVPASKQITDLENQRRAQSPLQDTVGRWVAPFNGTIAITGPVILDPFDTRFGDTTPFPPYKGNGVTAAIQQNGNQLWSANLTAPGPSPLGTPTGVSAVNVVKGDRIYFRLQSGDDGARDQVQWDPKIAYTFTDQKDVNGLSQSAFQQSQDFTLAGRPHTFGMAPMNGTLRFEGTLHKTKATTDDVAVQVLLNGNPLMNQVVPAAAGSPPVDTPLTTTDFKVVAPTLVNGAIVGQQDKVEVKIAADSPIDVSAVGLDYQLYYVQADNTCPPPPAAQPPNCTPAVVDSTGKPLRDANGNLIFAFQVPTDTDIYPQNSLTGPNTPWTSDLTRTATAHASLTVGPNATAGDVVVTVKTAANGLIGKKTISLPASTTARNVATDFDVQLTSGTNYWFDFSIRNPDLSDSAGGQAVQLPDTTGKMRVVPSVLNWAGRQGYFPLSYRGWGFAGYNGDGARAAAAIDETAFAPLQRTDFPAAATPPKGFADNNNDSTYAKTDKSKGPAYAFFPSLVQARDATNNPIGTALPAWRGMKDNIIGGAGLMRASRSGVDTPSLGVGGGDLVQAVRRVGIAAPIFSLNANLVGAGGSFSVAPSFGLQDYVDMNGDGFPDIITPGNINYTDPRGGFYDSGAGAAVVNQDTSFAVGVGFGPNLIDIKPNSKGSVHTAQATASVSGAGATQKGTSSAQGGGSAAEAQYGFNVGGAANISATFTNPAAADPNVANTPLGAPDPTAALEVTLVDVNGDGLPDRVRQTPQGVFASFNRGYGFAPEILWSTGGFENNESYSASFGPTLGFKTPDRAFSAGAGLSEAINIPRYIWVDVNGDGILDRLRKDDSTGKVMVAFGTNSGLLPEVAYGTMASSTFNLVGQIPVGQQIALDRTDGLGAGFDITIGVGPLCIVACYLIVNPGVHFDHSVSRTEIGLIDVYGDGSPDVVQSTADNQLAVHHSNVGKTNLLKAVHNSLGGTISIDFKRDGHTVDQPNPVWTLSSVKVDDGRAGTGVQVRMSTYEYGGNCAPPPTTPPPANNSGCYNRLEREMLGYSSVIAHQLATDGSIIRSITQTYLNDNVFDSGLLANQAVTDAGGSVLQQTTATWEMRDLKSNAAVDPRSAASDPDPVVAAAKALQLALAPVQAQIQQCWFHACGQGNGVDTHSTFTYDLLGNVTNQVDFGSGSGQEVNSSMQYTTCPTASTLACLGAPLPGAGGVPPYWNNNLCPSWTSLPAVLTIRRGSAPGGGQVLRQRDGTPGLCDNGAVTDLREKFGTGASDFAETQLGFDAWGSYNHVRYPRNATGQQATVDSVYDASNHTDVVKVTDSHGLTATAVFDGPTGRIASRTDANGQVTSYTYDKFGRIATITGPYEQSINTPTVSIEYHADNPNYAYAVAHNFDLRHTDKTIDTATFVDGTGRTTQTKRNGTLYQGVTTPARDVMLVSPAMEFDALGRTVAERYPVSERMGAIGTFNTDTSMPQTHIDFDPLDRQVRVETPGGLVTTTHADFGSYATPPGVAPAFSATLFKDTVTDALGHPQTTWTDVRGNVWAVDTGSPPLHTDYIHDPLGQLVQSVDSGRNVSTYGYDLLGRQTSINTPDGGLVENQFDGAGNLVGQITPNLRATGQQISYSYDVDRLTGITYPAGSNTPNVTYAYGAPGAPGNAAGRLTTLADGARTRQLTYDRRGQVASEVAIMNLHTGPSAPLTTSFTYHSFGRLLTVYYPDDEVVTNQYDSGGLLSSMQGVKGTLVVDFLKRQEYNELQFKRYQEFGNGVHTEFNFDPNTLSLARQTTTAPTRIIQDLNYTYDGIGNVLKLDNKADGPQPGLLGGPSSQTYSYDAHDRLMSANGTAPDAPNKVRTYSYAATYDTSGNIASKSQQDLVSKQVQQETSYDWNFTYKPAPSGGPHQIATAGGNSYTYDANGNFTQLLNSKGKADRSVTWDAANRATTISDNGSSTDYLYDSEGLLGVQRGPGGETAFVNNWYQFTNDGWLWKEIWAGNERIAQATEQGPNPLDYYEHKDLQGSTNIVTDETGQVFEHMEYFPSGEIWIHENSTTHRTPDRFVGALNDEVRNLDLLGQRWYQPREQVFYSPEPLLSTDPGSTIGDPRLLSAYTYAESNGLRLSDDTGTAPGNPLTKLLGRFGSDKWSSITEVGSGERPGESTITVTSTLLDEGGSVFDPTAYGGHAVIYLAVPGGTAENPTMKHYRLDLAPDQSPESRDGAVRIGIVPVDDRGWPAPEASTSWRIGDEQAQAALARAVIFRRHQADYTFGYTGIGCNRYNCALFAEKILKAAGVKQSAGLVFSTPLQVVKNQKLPNKPQPKAPAEAPATLPGGVPHLYVVD